MARKKEETLVLFRDVQSITRKFTDEQFGVLIRAAFSYRFEGAVYSGDDVAVDVAFQAVANQIDRYSEFCEKQSSNAKSGGIKPDRAKCSQSQPKDTPILSSPILSSPIQEGVQAAKLPTRHKHGAYSNVLLTDDDLLKLKTEFPSDWNGRIEKLSEYIASTGKKYKNHLATIRNWARREQEEVKNNGKTDVPSIRIIDQSV